MGEIPVVLMLGVLLSPYSEDGISLAEFQGRKSSRKSFCILWVHSFLLLCSLS